MSHGRRFTEFWFLQRSGFSSDGGLEEKQASGWEKDHQHPVPHKFPDDPANQLAAIVAVTRLLALLPDSGPGATTEFVRVVVGDGDRDAVIVEHGKG